MAFGDDLSVRVSAQTGDFERGIESSQDKLNGFRNSAITTSGALQGLQGRADEAGDEIGSIGVKSTIASSGLTQLSIASSAANASLNAFATTLAVGVIPTVGLLVTALLPLTAALGGLAAIVGSVGLVGFVGVLGAVKTNTTTLKQEFEDLVATIKTEFAPLFDAVSFVLVTLINDLEDVVSQLVPTQAQIDIIVEEFLDLGSAIIGILPAISNLVFSLATEFLPVVKDIAFDVLPAIPGAVRFLVDTFRELQGGFGQTAAALGKLLPPLFELGFVVLDVLGPKLQTLVDVIAGAATFVNNLSDSGQRLAVQLGLVAGPAGALAALIGGPLGIAVAGVIVGFSVFREELIAIGKTVANQATPALQRFSKAILSARNQAEALKGPLQDVAEFLQPLVEPLESLGETVIDAAESMADSLSPAFESLGGAAEDAEGPLTDFAKSSRSALRGFIQFLQTFVVPIIEFIFTRVIAPAVNEAAKAFADNINPIISEATDTVDALSKAAKALGDIFKSVWQAIKPVVMPIIKAIADAIGTILVQAIEGLSSAIKGVLNIMQGDFDDAANNFKNVITAITDAVAELAKELSEGFIDALKPLADILEDWLNSGADWLDNRIDEGAGPLTKAFEDFGDAINQTLANALDFAGIAADAIGEMGSSFANGIESIASDIASFGTDIGNALIDAINEAVPNELSFTIDPIKVEGQTVVPGQTISTNIPNNPLQSAQTGGYISQGGLLNVHQGERVVPSAQVTDRGEVEASGGPSEVMVTVEGDTDVIRNVSAEVIEQRERRAKRQTGGTTGI